MKEIAIVYGGNLSQVNGVVSVIKQTVYGMEKYSSDIKIKGIFTSKGVISIETCLNSEKSYIGKRGKNSTLRCIVGKVIRKSTILSYIRYKQLFIYPAQKAARLAIENTSADVLLVVEDIFSAYYLCKYGEARRILFVSHQDEVLHSQLFLSLPKLKFKPIKKKLHDLGETVYCNVRQIICVSNKTANLIENKYKNVCCVHNGFEFKNQQQKKERVKGKLSVVSIGNVGYRKGFDRIVELAKECKDKNKSIDFVCVGKGPEERDFEKTALSFDPNREYIRFVGFQSDVRPFLENADLFILLSRNEALPVSIIEAMSYGLPIIATDVGGVGELLGDNNPLLIHDYSKETVYQLIIDIYENNINYEAIGNENKRRYKKEFSTKGMANNYEKIITSLKV